MATFQIPENHEIISWFDLPLNRTMKLLLWGGDGRGNKLQLALDPPASTVNLQVLPDRVPEASTLFTLRGGSSGVSFSVTACVPGTTVPFSKDLKVHVRGNPKRQPGYSVDLLANVALTGNALEVYRYSRIIKDPQDRTQINNHILCQDTRGGHYNCGDVAAAYGKISNPDPKFYLNAPKYKAKKIFSKPVYLQNRLYYMPPKSRRMADLRFNSDAVRRGILKIQNLLDNGTPVRVWLIHDDGFAIPVIQRDWRTHYLTIIGYSGTKFLYLDPWPTGSSLDYDGGMYPKTTIAFMGELVFDLSRPELGIGSPIGAGGAHKYKVIAGP
jgi:hypothetical protein